MNSFKVEAVENDLPRRDFKNYGRKAMLVLPDTWDSLVTPDLLRSLLLRGDPLNIYTLHRKR